jgi:hypothetical protein
MENGDLEKQPESLDMPATSTDAGLANAEPDRCALTADKPAITANEPARTEPVVNSLQPAAKESLWQRLRHQPRETAAVVVLVVTAIIWLDSGDSNSQKSQTPKPLDPMDGFESYLSDFETEKSSTPLRESADPVENQSPASYGGDMMIPQTQQSEFASTVTANYGDSVSEPNNSPSNNPAISTTAARNSAAQNPADADADADAFGSAAFNTNAGSAAFDMHNSGSQQTRRVRFAGRIKPAN